MRLVVGIGGATGVIYGIRLLEVLKGVPEVETHLVVSHAARRTIADETDYAPADVEALATWVYDDRDIGAALATSHAGTLIARPATSRSKRGARWSWWCGRRRSTWATSAGCWPSPRWAP